MEVAESDKQFHVCPLFRFKVNNKPVHVHVYVNVMRHTDLRKLLPAPTARTWPWSILKAPRMLETGVAEMSQKISTQFTTSVFVLFFKFTESYKEVKSEA